MRFLLAATLFFSALIFNGCMVVPMFDDYDPNAVDQNMQQLESQRMERMRKNPSINEAEYQALQSKTMGGGASLPPPPTVEELRRQVEAEKKK